VNTGRRRVVLALPLAMSTLGTPARADASSAGLASYYDRHLALVGDTAWGWAGRGTPRALMPGVVQVGVARERWFALRTDGSLVAWDGDAAKAQELMTGVQRFAAGESGWFAIDRAGGLWRARGGAAPVRVIDAALDACIGDSADYFVARDGTLHVQGLAHRGQYGDGLLRATDAFVPTARDAVAVRAHTGHAIYLGRDGTVFGTGGNRFGPLGRHGLGDKADRWGPIFSGAAAIATGSRHSLALRADGSLWAWGEGFAIEPARIMDKVTETAAGDTVTLARTADGALWQWDGGGTPRRLVLR
jgi:Regulator of chromosome condensation (RCC1) repeat